MIFLKSFVVILMANKFVLTGARHLYTLTEVSPLSKWEETSEWCTNYCWDKILIGDDIPVTGKCQVLEADMREAAQSDHLKCEDSIFRTDALCKWDVSALCEEEFMAQTTPNVLQNTSTIYVQNDFEHSTYPTTGSDLTTVSNPYLPQNHIINNDSTLFNDSFENPLIKDTKLSNLVPTVSAIGKSHLPTGLINDSTVDNMQERTQLTSIDLTFNMYDETIITTSDEQDFSMGGKNNSENATMVHKINEIFTTEISSSPVNHTNENKLTDFKHVNLNNTSNANISMVTIWNEDKLFLILFFGVVMCLCISPIGGFLCWKKIRDIQRHSDDMVLTPNTFVDLKDIDVYCTIPSSSGDE